LVESGPEPTFNQDDEERAVKAPPRLFEQPLDGRLDEGEGEGE